MENKLTAQQLSGKRLFQVEIDLKHNFSTNKIQVVSISQNSMSDQHITYYNEIDNAISAVVVPNDTVCKLLNKEEADHIEQRYKQFILKDISQHLSYHGMVGSDPEIFAENEDGSILPAFNFLPSKENPIKFNTQGLINNLYWDGFQAEFTTNASVCLDSHSDSIRAGLKGIYAHMIKHNPKAKLSTQTVFEIPFDLIQNSKSEHVAFGCLKSLNAYGMTGLEADGRDVFYRTAGGHIHFGFSAHTTHPKSQESIVRMVKALDAILGIASVSLFATLDNPMRRQMYGLAGEYRLPPHGLEYRTLSNAWMFHPLMTHIVFDLARSASVFGEKHLMTEWNATEKETIEVINTANVNGAREILKRNKDMFLKILNARYKNTNKSQFVYDVIMNGMDWIVKDPKNIVGNWGLEDAAFPYWSNNVGKKVATCFDPYTKLNVTKV